MTYISRRTVAAIALTVAATTAPVAAHADQVDQVLAALPAGPISCEQASKYWTNEADYNNKVSQANLLAMVDPRGPQIRDALARVDEAANRCGLKGGGAAPAPAPAPAPGNNAPAPAPAPANNAPAPAPAPANNAPAPAGAINSSAPGLPSFNVQLPGGQWITVPNLQQIVADFLAKYGIRI